MEKNLDLKLLDDTSPFRKVAMGTWVTAKDPSVYGLVELNMKKTLDLLPTYQEKHKVKITPNHLVGKAYAQAVKNRPEINAMIRGSKIYLRPHLDIFYQVNIPGSGADKIKKATLSGAVVREVERKSLAQIALELKEKAEAVKSGKDKEIAKNLEMFKLLPWWFARYYLNLASFLIYGLNINLSKFGIPRDPFGSVMITNVGGLGIDVAYAPLCPYTRVPLLLTVGGITDRAWVEEGQVVVRPILPVSVTFDHRLIDGIHASQMCEEFKKCFAEPEKYLFND